VRAKITLSSLGEPVYNGRMWLLELEIIYVGLIGLVIGSAINAVVWRLHEGRSWVRGRSMCPNCKHELAAVDLVPVLSWLCLRGRCRYCAKPISWQYPAVELVTAGLFTLSALAWQGSWWLLAIWLVELTLLIVMSVYDLRWMILPNRVMVPALGVAVVYAAVAAALSGDWTALGWSAVAAVVAGGVFYLLAVLTKGRGMGGGDIKLAFVMGVLLGPLNTFVAMETAFMSAAVIGMLLWAARVIKRRAHIPFGPFLVAGTVFAQLYGQAIVRWYLRLNNIG